MKPRLRAGALLTIALLAAASFATQTNQRSGATRLPANTLPAPEIRTAIGTSTIAITTSSPEAQRFFNQGLNLLHCFWDFEAYRAFREAARLDPEAPMAQWGLFLSLGYNPSEQSEARGAALRRARSLASRATEREQLYIAAIEALHANSGRSAQDAYIAAMEHLLVAFPEDHEAKLVLAKFLVADAGGVYRHPDRPETRSSFERAKQILEPLLESHPDSVGVNHYWIHAHEAGPHPERALDSARKLATLGAGAGHTIHMPGHIHFRMGSYGEAYRAFQSALRFDREYMAREGVSAIDNWSYAHNLDYLIANCAEDGRYAEGQRYARELQGQPVDLKRESATGLGYLVYGARTAPARLDFRYGHWDRAAAALRKGLAEWRFASQISADYVGGLLAYAETMASVDKADFASAATSFRTLAEVGARLTQEQARVGSDWYFEAAKRVLSIAVMEAAATLLSAQGQHDRAMEQIGRASQMEAALGYGEPPHYGRPIAESLGSIHLRAGSFAEARAAFQEALHERPNSGHPWIGIARSWVGSGDLEQATAAYRRLLEVWSNADEDLPQVLEAKRWLEAHP